MKLTLPMFEQPKTDTKIFGNNIQKYKPESKNLKHKSMFIYIYIYTPNMFAYMYCCIKICFVLNNNNNFSASAAAPLYPVDFPGKDNLLESINVTDLPILFPFQSQCTPSPGFTHH